MFFVTAKVIAMFYINVRDYNYEPKSLILNFDGRNVERKVRE